MQTANPTGNHRVGIQQPTLSHLFILPFLVFLGGCGAGEALVDKAVEQSFSGVFFNEYEDPQDIGFPDRALGHHLQGDDGIDYVLHLDESLSPVYSGTRVEVTGDFDGEGALVVIALRVIDTGEVEATLAKMRADAASEADDVEDEENPSDEPSGDPPTGGETPSGPETGGLQGDVVVKGCVGDAFVESEVEIKNFNDAIMRGQCPIVVVPMNFTNAGFGDELSDTLKQQFRQSFDMVASHYETHSRGFVKLVGPSGGKIPILAPFNSGVAQSCAGRGAAIAAFDRALGAYRKMTARVFAFPKGTCTYGGNAGTNNVRLNNGGAQQGSTAIHEIGHIFRLNHGMSFTRRDGKIVGLDAYGDITTPMGRTVAGPFNAPQQHRLGWLRGADVRAIKATKTRYELRALSNYNAADQALPAALVYEEPHTGYRTFISLRRRGDVPKRQFFLEHEAGLVMQQASPCRSCSMPPTTLFAIFNGQTLDENNQRVDELGLVFEDLWISADGGRAKVTISVDASRATCGRPLDILPQVSLNKNAGGTCNSATIDVEVKNPNPDTCRPYVFYDPTRFSANNNASIKLVSGSANLPSMLSGGQSVTLRLMLTRDPKRAEPVDAVVRIGGKGDVAPTRVGVDFQQDCQ